MVLVLVCSTDIYETVSGLSIERPDMYILQGYNIINRCSLCAVNNFLLTTVRTKKMVSINKQAKFLRKLLLDTKQKRKNWARIDEHIKTSFENTVAVPNDIHKECKTNKRVVVLNKLFMKHITDLMATGQYSDQILGHGLEISRVQVASGFNFVNVYWIAKGTEKDVEIEKLLRRLAGALQHELSSLRVLGVVPEIQFVKDKSLAKSAEVESLLQVADFGEDYTPSDPSESLKTEFTMETSLPSNIREKILELEDEVPIPSELLPPMRQDVFGLNHSEIIGRIIASTEKSKAMHRYQDNIEVDGHNSEVLNRDNVIRPSTLNENTKFIQFDKENFSKFIQKHEIMRKKFLKQNSDARLELIESDYSDNYEGPEVVYEEEEDFIEEVEDFKYKD